MRLLVLQIYKEQIYKEMTASAQGIMGFKATTLSGVYSYILNINKRSIFLRKIKDLFNFFSIKNIYF